MVLLPGQSTRGNEPDPRYLGVTRGKITKLSDDELIGYVHSKSGSGDDGVDPTHLVLQKLWFINIVHMVGLQSFDSYNLFEDIDPNFVFTDDTFVANHLFRIMMSGASRLMQSKPDWDVIPRSPDQEDQEAAKVGQHLLDWAYDQHHLRALRMELAFWLQACGTSFIEFGWDKSLGEEQKAYLDPYAMMEGNGENRYLSAGQVPEDGRKFLEKVGAVETMKEGDLYLSHCSGFQVIVPHAYERLKEMPWMILKHRRSIDWIADHYPDKWEQVGLQDLATNKDGQYWWRLSTLINRHGFTIPSRGAENQDQVETLTLIIPPSVRCPEGVWGVIAGQGTVLENGPHKFKQMGLDIRFPVVDFHYCPVPGRFWSMGILEHLIGPQREYNRARSQIISHRDTLAVPQWMAPQECELTNTRNDIGDLWEYRYGFGKPELVNPPAMSQIHLETEERAISDMQQISAQSDVTQAQVPQGVRSGVAIRALQERDYSVLGVPVENMEIAFQSLGGNILKLFWKNMKSTRAIEIYGEKRMADISFFSGADIRGNTSVRIESGSMMPRSKAETQELMLDLLQMGALNPAENEDDKKVLFDALEVGGVEQFFLEQQLDRRRARIENELFHKPRMGQAWPGVSTYDDHEVHIREHTLFMKTDSYERLPPMRKIVFEAHLLKHEQEIMAMQEAMMALQAPVAGPAGPGQPAGPGGGSPPKKPGKPSPPARKQPAPGNEGVSAA